MNTKIILKIFQFHRIFLVVIFGIISNKEVVRDENGESFNLVTVGHEMNIKGYMAVLIMKFPLVLEI